VRTLEKICRKRGKAGTEILTLLLEQSSELESVFFEANKIYILLFSSTRQQIIHIVTQSLKDTQKDNVSIGLKILKT
jgi:hypothetical protein